MKTPVIASLLLAASLLSGCASGSDDGGGEGAGEDQKLTVLAAASLTDVYEDLAAKFEAAHDGVSVQFSFGSSTDLAEQAADGAPGDVLATADEASMQMAEDAGVTGDVTTFATNVITIVTPPDNPGEVTDVDSLDGATWVRCVDDAPCGRVALLVLEDNGLTAEPASLEEDVRATLDKVISGEADAGLVYASDAVAAGADVTAIPIDGSENFATEYFISVLDQSGDAELAQAWLDFVTGHEGTAALTDAGFGTP